MQNETGKKNAVSLLKQGNIRFAVGLALLLNIIVWIILLSKFGINESVAPLHFNVIYGIDEVGKTYQIYQVPIFGLLVLAVNMFFAREFYNTKRFFSRLLLWSTVFVQILLLIAVSALSLQI